MATVDLATSDFVIIGGTSKAGTTAVFTYLSDHPSVCASMAKETRFFLDLDYPLDFSLACDRDGPSRYLDYFNHCRGRSGTVFLEATPDYLHSAGTAQRISRTIKNVRFVFILRNPISRIYSWYRFGKAMDVIPHRMSFKEYIEAQKDHPQDLKTDRRHPAFLALAQGRYSRYLEAYTTEFGHESVHIAFYEDLRDRPGDFMARLCNYIGIDSSMFVDYDFVVVNRGVNVKNPTLHRRYIETRQRLRDTVRKSPKLRTVLRRLRRSTDSLYRRLNVLSDRTIDIPSECEAEIASYYNSEYHLLKAVLPDAPPWEGFPSRYR